MSKLPHMYSDEHYAFLKDRLNLSDHIFHELRMNSALEFVTPNVTSIQNVTKKYNLIAINELNITKINNLEGFVCSVKI